MDEARRLDREMSMTWFMRVMTRLQSRALRERIRVMSGYLMMERI
jgi:hypothetical protein